MNKNLQLAASLHDDTHAKQARATETCISLQLAWCCSQSLRHGSHWRSLRAHRDDPEINQGNSTQLHPLAHTPQLLKTMSKQSYTVYYLCRPGELNNSSQP